MWKVLETYIAPYLALVVLCAGLYVVYVMYASTSVSADWPKSKAAVKTTGLAAEKVSVYSSAGEGCGASNYQTMYSRSYCQNSERLKNVSCPRGELRSDLQNSGYFFSWNTRLSPKK